MADNKENLIKEEETGKENIDDTIENKDTKEIPKEDKNDKKEGDEETKKIEEETEIDEEETKIDEETEIDEENEIDEETEIDEENEIDEVEEETEIDEVEEETEIDEVEDDKTTVEEYNKENTKKYDTVTTQAKPKSSGVATAKKAKKKSRGVKRFLLFLIYCLIVLIIILLFVRHNKIEESQMESLIDSQFEAVQIVNPLKENIKSDILTNEAALADYTDTVIGYVEIPSVDLKAPIYQGASNANEDMERVMHYSIGHEPESYLPGEGGKIVLTGHREEQFKALKDVKRGDVVIVVIGDNTFLYEVDDIGTVKPENSEDIAFIRGDTEEEVLTMYTCYPFTPFTPVTDRYYVSGKRVEEYEFQEVKA